MPEETREQLIQYPCEDGPTDALADEDGDKAEPDATGDEAERDITCPEDLFGTKPGLGRLGPDMAPVRTRPVLKRTRPVLKKMASALKRGPRSQ